MQNLSYKKFSTEGIFLNKEANAVVDNVYSFLIDSFSEDVVNENVLVVGSVAQNMQAVIDTEVKDLDIQIRDREIFEMLATLNRYFPYTVKAEESRIIVYSSPLLIDIFYNTEEVLLEKVFGIVCKKYN